MPPKSQDSLVVALRKHKTKLEELRKLLFFGEDRRKITGDNIDLFEADLREIIKNLEACRNEKGISNFVASVDAIQGKVNKAVDKLYLASETFDQKNRGLEKRLQYFNECCQCLTEALATFKPTLTLSDTNEDAHSA